MSESLDAIREVWMQGYNHARREMGLPPLVRISREDVQAAYAGECACRETCPACQAKEMGE